MTAELQVGARLDRLPGWPFSRAVFAVLGAGFFCAYFDITNIGSALPKALEQFHAPVGSAGTVVGLGLWGYVAGAVLNSVLADRWGRRPGLMTATLLFGLGSLASALSPGITTLTVARFVSGMGIGAALSVVSTYLSEVAPARRRGRYMSWVTLPALLGNSAVPWFALWLVPSYSWGWRLMLAIPALAMVAFAFGFRVIPESPRWQAARGREERALRAVADAEQRVRARTGLELPEPVPARPVPVASGWRAWLTLVRPPHLKWTVLFFTIFFCVYFSAYSFTGLGITLLTQHGLSLTKSISLTLGSSFGGLIGAALAPLIADRWPRKVPAAATTILLAADMIVLGVHPGNALFAAGYFLLSFQLGIFAPMVYLLTAEHFPTQVRNAGVAITDGAGHAGGAIGPAVTLAVFQAGGFGATWLTLGLIFLLASLLLLLARNTTGVALEKASGGELAAARSAVVD
ncbi:MFS transporter [Amycolatopsis acidiphila]|uniref:MFS transporter n=1 Tax=Amycolatopsis acidiphila TaxID=715473 RepID=UPI0016439275|nr:MFS transporter [Amycolatopsis acidiphila]UIJ63232.1 MFS transporter [Amycolatopsis acidiphila]GHG74499.1 MFS transporter [Amycolatopsis acidiphila]